MEYLKTSGGVRKYTIRSYPLIINDFNVNGENMTECCNEKQCEESQRASLEALNSHIIDDKVYRKELDVILQKIKASDRKSRERSLTITKLQEAIMWLGMDLKEINDTNPYPNSYNPENTIIDKTADNLKF